MNGNTNKALITIVVALIIGFGTFLVSGAQKAEQAQNATELLRSEVRGELALIRADQARTREDMARVLRMLERRDRDK